MSDLDTTDIRHIKFMRGAYTLPPNLARLLFLKSTKLQVIFSIKILLISMPIPMKWKPNMI